MKGRFLALGMDSAVEAAIRAAGVGRCGGWVSQSTVKDPEAVPGTRAVLGNNGGEGGIRTHGTLSSTTP